MEQVSCQTNGSIDIPSLITDPLSPIFVSQLCPRSKAIHYISKSLPILSTLNWVCVTEEDLMVDAAEQALNELYMIPILMIFMHMPKPKLKDWDKSTKETVLGIFSSTIVEVPYLQKFELKFILNI